MTNLTYAIADSPRRLRRHVTPGERAMGYAMRHPELEKRKRKQNAINEGHPKFGDWLLQDDKDTKADKIDAVNTARIVSRMIRSN